MSVIGLVGFYGCLCMGHIQGQASDKSKVTPFERQRGSVTKLVLPKLDYPYYEWVAKDTALTWVEKPDGSVVAAPLTGENRTEQRISGASDVKDMGDSRPYGLKMSPDRSKILFIMAPRGSRAGEWRVGTLNGTSYTRGPLLFPQTPDLVWKRNSKEWVSLVWSSIIDGDLSGSVMHYYTDGKTPPKEVLINPSPITRLPPKAYATILGLRQDGIAIVPVRDHLEKTEAVDIYLVDVDEGRVLPGKHHVLLPKDMYLREMILSHSGDRIAWVFASEIVRLTDGESKTDYLLNVWRSNSDGSELKRLESFPPHLEPNPLPGQPYLQLSVECPIRWTIDDAAISCLDGEALQIVPVK